jgi:hypothetical protein
MNAVPREADFTDFRSELDRKAFEALERLVAHNAIGKVGHEAMVVGIRTVWDTVSGLAGETVSDLACQMLKQVERDGAGAVTRVFHKKGAFNCAVKWAPGTTTVYVLLPSGRVESFAFATENDAKRAFAKTCLSRSRAYEEF